MDQEAYVDPELGRWLAHAQGDALAWLRRAHPDHDTRAQAVKLLEEAGEVAAEVLRFPGPLSKPLAAEIADVVIVLLTIAEREGCDLAHALSVKLEALRAETIEIERKALS